MAGVDDLEAVIAAVAALPADPADLADPADQPDPVLVARMRQLVRLRAMVDAALVEQVAAFDARAGARYDGQTSTAAWLRSRLRLGADVPDLVRVARELAGLRRALQLRDGGCRFAGCDRPGGWCDAHHVRHLGGRWTDQSGQSAVALPVMRKSA